MKLFRMANRHGTPWWVFAEDVDEGKAISVLEGCAKKIENVKLIGDQTDFYRPTTDLDKVDVKGIASLRMPAREWVVSAGRHLVKDPAKGGQP